MRVRVLLLLTLCAAALLLSRRADASGASSPQRDYGDPLPGPYETTGPGPAGDDGRTGAGTAGDNDSGEGGHGPGVPYNHTVAVLAAAGYNTTYVIHPAAGETAAGETAAGETAAASATDPAARVSSRIFEQAPHPWYDPWRGHIVELANPIGHFTVAEPVAGCRAGNGGARVEDTAAARHCVVATNAGFFNTHTHECLGNIVADGRIVQVPGTQNVNFGITAGGEFVVGYLNDSHLAQMEFHTLVAGVVWLVRDGVPFVRVSEKAENMATQESGGGFVGLHAARIALGHTRNGSLVIVHVETHPGISLYDFADFLVAKGVYNAINLDGGGSVTLVQDGELRNYVTDACEPNSIYKCQRHVSTITCIHDAPPPLPPPPPPPSPPPPSPPPSPSPLDPTREQICALYDCGGAAANPSGPSGVSTQSLAVALILVAAAVAGLTLSVAWYLDIGAWCRSDPSGQRVPRHAAAVPFLDAFTISGHDHDFDGRSGSGSDIDMGMDGDELPLLPLLPTRNESLASSSAPPAIAPPPPSTSPSTRPTTTTLQSPTQPPAEQEV